MKCPTQELDSQDVSFLCQAILHEAQLVHENTYRQEDRERLPCDPSLLDVVF